MTDRRRVITGAAGAMLATLPLGRATALPAESAGDAPYHYLFVELADGDPSARHAALIAALKQATHRPDPDFAIVALLSPQLGWTAHHVAVLLRWSSGAQKRDAAINALARNPAVKAIERHALEPTLRPAADVQPEARGIYTNRWFEVRDADVAEAGDSRLVPRPPRISL